MLHERPVHWLYLVAFRFGVGSWLVRPIGRLIAPANESDGNEDDQAWKHRVAHRMTAPLYSRLTREDRVAGYNYSSAYFFSRVALMSNSVLLSLTVAEPLPLSLSPSTVNV